MGETINAEVRGKAHAVMSNGITLWFLHITWNQQL